MVNGKIRNKGKSIIDFPEDYTVIDLETTGLYPGQDSIIEVAAIRYRDHKEVSRFTELIKPKPIYNFSDEEEHSLYEESDFDDYGQELLDAWQDRRDIFIDDFISSLTGITNEMLSAARTEKEVLKDYFEFLGNDVLVGHNVSFDINFLYDAKLADFDELFQNDHINTIRLLHKLVELPTYKLGFVCEHYGINAESAHRALEDVHMTAQVFEEARSAALSRYGSYEAFKKLFSYKHSGKHDRKRVSDFFAQGDPDPESPFYGKKCCITGKLDKMTRNEALQLLVNIGAINSSSVTKDTAFLILGNNDYCSAIKDGKSTKHKKAEQLKLKGCDIEIIPENVFYTMIEEGD